MSCAPPRAPRCAAATETVAANEADCTVCQAPVDAFPIVNRYPDKPLAYNVVWKTTIYMLAASFVHYLENLYDFWRRADGLIAANAKLLSEIVWPHFWATEILLLALIFMYCTMRELIRVIGKDKVREMFFGAPPNARTER